MELHQQIPIEELKELEQVLTCLFVLRLLGSTASIASSRPTTPLRDDSNHIFYCIF
jgi:hypothetical protein